MDRRMLIVDDEADVCDCLQTYFEDKGFSVSCAFSGEEALEKLSRAEADIVLLDIKLPGLSGIEVLKRVQKQYRGIKVIMVSALDEVGLRREANYYGAEDYITKPFDFDEKTWSAVLNRSA